VTARKTLERREDVPLALDVLGDADLRRSSITDLQSLAARVPGLTFDSAWGGGLTHTVLRGQQQATLAGDNVGVFVDGVYQASQDMRDIEMLDVARVEIARGPQSALFGRSTFAGAIHYVSAPPNAALDAGLAIDTGSDGLAAARAFVTGPLGGRLLGRIAVGERAADGTWRNVADGGSLGDYRRSSLAATLATSDAFAWHGSLQLRIGAVHAGTPAHDSLDYTDFNCGARVPSAVAWSYYCGTAPTAASLDLSAGLPDSSGRTRQGTLRFTVPLGTLELDTASTWYRGHLAALRDADSSSGGDAFGVCTTGVNCTGPVGATRLVNRLVVANVLDEFASGAEEVSQEIRLASTEGAIVDWLVGVFAYRSRANFLASTGVERGGLTTSERLTAYVPGDPVQVGPVSILNNALVDAPNVERVPRNGFVELRHGASIFGAVGRRITETLEVRGELRAGAERLHFTTLYDAYRPVAQGAFDTVRFDEVTPRLSVEYRPAERLSLYASRAKGSRGGGINAIPNLLQEERGYAPESNWTTELGLRFRGNGRLRTLDVTAFHIEWDDTQIQGFANTPGVTGLIVRNTAGVRTTGLESALSVVLVDWLTFDAAFSWLDAAYKPGSDSPGDNGFCGLGAANAVSNFCTVGAPRVASAAGLSVVPRIDGLEPARVPSRPWHVGITAEPQRDLAGGRVWVRADVGFQDDIADRPVGGLYYGERAVLDARVGYSRAVWSLELWGKNLTDEEFVRASAPGFPAYYPSVPRPIDLFYGERRRVGLTVNVALR
jgi:iron complex outermembrane recepter protein